MRSKFRRSSIAVFANIIALIVLSVFPFLFIILLPLFSIEGAALDTLLNIYFIISVAMLCMDLILAEIMNSRIRSRYENGSKDEELQA
jgi:uncharacterized membrane protein (DUF485 family)